MAAQATVSFFNWLQLLRKNVIRKLGGALSKASAGCSGI
jgi:hypothetical protein